MALVIAFTREPINHGDAGVYHDYVMAQMRRGGEGGLSCELYNSSGALYLSKGSFGIYDSATPARGACNVTTEGEIDKSGGTAGLWHAVEVSVSGTAGTPTITAIAGATDESIIPASIKAAYQYDKQGYYITTSKRLLGIVFLRAALALGRIVNCESGKIGFKGIKIIESIDAAGTLSNKYIASLIQAIGDWDMDASSNVHLSMYNNTTFQDNVFSKILRIDTIIFGDVLGVAVHPLRKFLNAVDPDLIAGGIQNISKESGGSGAIALARRTGGYFDNANYDSVAYNRGWVYIEYET